MPRTAPRRSPKSRPYPTHQTRQPPIPHANTKQDLLGLLLLLLLVGHARHLRRLVGDWRAAKARMGDRIFSLLRELPPVRRKLEVCDLRHG